MMWNSLRSVLLLLALVHLWLTALASGESVEFKRHDHQIEILVGGRAFATYHFDPAVAKPYLSPLRSAQGTIVTRSFPMVSDLPGEDHDEPHQRALYFAHGDMDGFDFWGEAAFASASDHSASTFGRTVFRGIDEMRGGSDDGVLKAEFHLVTAGGKAIADETQAYMFRGDEHSRIIDCQFTVHANHGPIKMGDTKEGTFAIRVVKALDSPPGHMVDSNGATGEKGIWGKRADWVDYYGNVAGEEVGIAIFDNPGNLRHPTTWHARGYGLFAANPFGLKQFTHDESQDGSYTIPGGGRLLLRYRVLIHHGDYKRARVAEAYKQYAESRKQ